MKHFTKLTAVGAALVLAAATVVALPRGTQAISSCPTDPLSSFTPQYTNYNDSSSINVGVKFKVNSAPYIRGVKFYKGVDNTGTHVAHLRELGGGSDLASVTFSGETSSGWQSVNFGSDVPVTPSATYIVWVSLPNGHYAVDTTGAHRFTALNPVGNPASDAVYIPAGNSGYYKYSGSDTTPPDTSTANNYWVSPVVADTTAPTGSGTLSASASSNGTYLSWTTKGVESNSGYSLYGLWTDLYRSDGTNTVRVGREAADSLEWTNQQVNEAFEQRQDHTTLPGTTYTYSTKTTDACGNQSNTTSNSVTTSSQSLSNIFTTNPANLDTGQTGRVVVGMRWKPAVNGKVWGIRIYRAAGTMPTWPTYGTGDQIRVSLWDASTQTRLGTQYIASGNDQSGWIDVRFDSPVNVTANTTYVAGYYSPNGLESYTNNTFNSVVTNGNLSTIVDSSGTPNGVYDVAMIDQDSFPTTRATNAKWYGIDVDFFTP